MITEASQVVLDQPKDSPYWLHFACVGFISADQATYESLIYRDDIDELNMTENDGHHQSTFEPSQIRLTARDPGLREFTSWASER